MSKLLRIIPIIFVLYSCVPVIGTATVGVIKTGVQISEDPRTFGTFVDDNIIEKSFKIKITIKLMQDPRLHVCILLDRLV